MFRITEHSGELISQSIVFESIQRQKFLETSCFRYDSSFGEDAQLDRINSLLDAKRAVHMLKVDMALDSRSGRWDGEGSESIDDAIDKARRVLSDLRARLVQENLAQSHTRSGYSRRTGRRAYLTVKEEPSQEGPFEERIEMLSKELRKNTGAKEVEWKSLGYTAAGRECQVLVIDGNQQHKVP